MFRRSSNNKTSAKASGYALHPARLWTLRLVLAILFLLAYKMSIAQTKGSAKLYAYRQNVSGGVAPDRSQSPGSATEAAGTNYYIYLVSVNGVRIYPSELWIDNTLYGVQMKSIAKTPITLESPDPALNSRELVPKTTQRVIQLIPVSSNGAKKSAKGVALARDHGVVAVYKQGGKFYYVTLSELSSLENAAMQ